MASRSIRLTGFPRSMAGWAAVFVACLLGAPPAFAQPAAAAADSSAASFTEPDYQPYQQLLDEIVVVISPKGAAIETRLNYSALSTTSDLTQRFMRIRDGLFRVPPSRLAPEARLAWSINAYNFLVIQLITENLYDRPVKAVSNGKEFRLRRRFESVQQIMIGESGFFDYPVVEIEGAPYSLAQFERAFVFGGHEREPGKEPPPGFDARAHFAVVSGAKGCPPLLRRAYRPDSIDAQLEFATRNALALPNQLRWNDRTNGPEITTMFDWHSRDFGGTDQIVDFVKRYCPEPMKVRIEQKNMRWIGTFIPWDGGLNHSSGEKSES